eukprot:gene4230-26965_t
MMQPMGGVVAVFFLAFAGVSSGEQLEVDLVWTGEPDDLAANGYKVGVDIEVTVFLKNSQGVPRGAGSGSGDINNVEVTFKSGSTVVDVQVVDVTEFGVGTYKFQTLDAYTKTGHEIVMSAAMVAGSKNADASTDDTESLRFVPDDSNAILVTPSVTTVAVPATPTLAISLVDQYGNPSEDAVNVKFEVLGANQGAIPDATREVTTSETFSLPEVTIVDVITCAFTFVDTPSLPGTSVDITFTNGVPTKLGLVRPADATVDDDHSVTVKLLDAYDNVVLEDGNTRVNFAVGNVAPVDVDISLSQGVGTATFVLTVPGTYAVTADDISDLCSPETCTEGSDTLQIAPGAPVEYFIVDPSDGSPADPTVPGSTDNTLDITVQARDQYENVATTQEADVTVVLSGTARFHNGEVAQITGGTGIVTIKDTVAEIVTVSLQDTANTGLDVFSTQQVRIYWGAPVKFYINQPGDANIRSRLSIIVEARDANNNIVESESRDVTMTVTGQAEPASQVVDIVNGRATVQIIDNILESVTLALVDSSSTGLVVDSTRDVTFEKMDPPPIIQIQVDETEEVAGNSIQVTATVKNGANTNLIEQDMLETATLYALVEATQVTTQINLVMNDPAQKGIGIYPFTTSKAGKVTMWVDSDVNLGVTKSAEIEVEFKADVPSVFTIDVDSSSVVVDNEIVATIHVADANGNPTDVGSLEVDVLMTGTESGTDLEAPLPNPTRLIFGNGAASSVILSSQTTEGVTITMANPVPNTIDVDDTIAVQFTQGDHHRMFFVPTASGTVDTSHTIKLVAGDVFYNHVDTADLTVTILVDDGISAAPESVAVTITNGLGEGSISRQYPCDITVTIAAIGGIDTSPTSTFSIAPGAATKYAITNPGNGDPDDPTAPGSVDNTVTVTVRAYDQYQNVATGEQRDVTMALTNSAEFQTGSGVLDIINGAATIVIKDDVAETVTMRLVDTGSTGLDVDSEETIRIYWGATTQFFILEIPFPNPVINGFKEVKVEARDQHNNLVEIEQRDVTIVVDGQASASLVSQGSDPKELVVITNGEGNGYVTTPVVGDVTITLEDTEGTGLNVDSSRVLPFLAVQDLDTKVDARTIVVTLTTAELNEIKKRKTLGTEQDDSFITFGGNAMTDLTNNPIQGLTVPKKAAKYTKDISPPTLTNFDLIQEGSTLKLILFFSETVSAVSIAPALITLQSSTSSPTFERALVATTVDASHADSDIITLIIAADDTDAIRALYAIGNPGQIGSGLGRTRADTHLSMKRGSVLDMVDLENIAVDAGNAMAVQNYDVDLISPVISSFTLNMDAEHLILTYSEAVTAASLDATQLVLQNAADPSLSFAVASSGSTVLSSTQIQVDLTKTFANSLKRLDTLATGESDTYLSVSINLVQDTHANLADPLEPTDGLQVSTYEGDETLAVLQFFDLDLSNSKLHLEFDEPVDGSTVDPSEIIIQGDVDGSSGTSYRLTGGNPELIFARVITVDLTYADVTKLKHDTDIATAKETTFLSTFERKEELIVFGQTVLGNVLPSLIAKDMADNNVDHVPAGAALQVRNYDGDIVATLVERFELNMETGFLFLTFVEPVNIGTANLAEVTLSSDQAGTATMPLSTLQAAMSETSSRSVQVELNKADLDEIKKLSLCEYIEDGADCYISYTSDFIKDNANIPIAGRPLGEGLAAADYVPDGTSPTVESFGTLDLNTGEIMISFSETVLVSSFDIFTVALQTGPATPNPSFGLSKITFNVAGGTVRDKDTPAVKVTFDLDHAELNRLKEDATICAIPSQCYLVLIASTVSDMAGNMLVETALAQPGLPVVDLVVDNEAPTVVKYDLDMDDHTLTLFFSESVDGSKLKPEAIYIQPTEAGSVATPAVKLTGGDAPTVRSDTIVIDLISDDVAALSARRLATSDTNTYIYFASTLVSDCAFNPNSVTAIPHNGAKKASQLIPDATAPQLKRFSLNLDKPLGEITLSFNEPVDPDTFDVTKITLQSEEVYNAATTKRYRLKDGALTPETDLNPASYIFALNEIVVVLVEADQTALKIDFGLAVSDETTWIVVDSADDTLDGNGNFVSANTMIKDASGKPVAQIGNDDALEITDLATDTRNPEVTDITIDFDAKTLVVKFNDVVDASSFKARSVTIQNL